jgi:hypothetical protein
MQLDVRGNTEVTGGAVRWREKNDQFNAAIHRADVSLNWQGGKRAGPGNGAWQTRNLVVNGRVDASGTALVEGRSITIQQTSLRLDWGERGMNSAVDVRLADGGSLKGAFFPLPAGATIPREGVLDVGWQGIDLALLHPWLPSGFDMQGRLSGRMTGSLLPESRFDLKEMLPYPRASYAGTGKRSAECQAQYGRHLLGLAG